MYVCVCELITRKLFVNMFIFKQVRKLCLVDLLSRLTSTKLTVMSDRKPPTVFNNNPLRLFNLTADSPLINSCPTQKIPIDDVRCFYLLFCKPSFPCVSTLSVVLRDCWHEITRPFAICAHSGQPWFFLSKYKSCTRTICADVCAVVSGHFHPNLSHLFTHNEMD